MHAAIGVVAYSLGVNRYMYTTSHMLCLNANIIHAAEWAPRYNVVYLKRDVIIQMTP